jgi:hypothetical protein
VSQVAAEILERGLKEQAETAGLGLLGPALESVVKRQVGRMSDRLAHLVARTALEAATTRRLVFQLLARHLTTEEARRLNQAAWTGSVDSLRKPAQGLRELRDDLRDLREHADEAWQRERESCRDPLEAELACERDQDPEWER